MCERYVLPNQADAEREFEPSQRWWKFAARYNVSFPQYVPALRSHDRVAEGVMVRWGFVPAVAEGIPPADEQPDVTVELVGQTPDTRGPWLNSQRCILPAAGFYGWQLTERRYRQPHFLHLADRPVFGIAALWERSVTEDDDVIESCAIVTVPANPLVARLSGPRMPAILRRKDYSTWLNATPVQAKAVLDAYPAEWMQAHPVSPRVNSLKNDDASLIRPVA